MPSKKILHKLILIACLGPASLQATDFTWELSPPNQYWSNPNNWSPSGGPPVFPDLAGFNTSPPVTIESAVSASAGTIEVSANQNVLLELSSNSSLTIGNGSGSGVIVHSPSGTAYFASTDGSVSNATCTIQSGSIGSGGGNVFYQPGNGLTVIFGADAEGVADPTIVVVDFQNSAGTFETNSDIIITDLNAPNSGNLVKLGGTLSYSPNHTGNFARITDNGKAGGLIITESDINLNNPLNTFSGGILFTSGAILQGSSGCLGSGPLTFDGGFLAPAGNFVSANPVHITGNSTIDTTDGNVTLSGPLTGNDSVLLALSGPNTPTLLNVQVPSGQFTIFGKLSIPPSGIVGITVTPSTTSSLAITETANLNGQGTLEITANPGVYPKGSTYTILTANAITGEFGSWTILGGNANLISSLAYTTTSIELSLYSSSFTPYQLSTLSGNNRRLADYLNDLVTESVPLGSSFIALTGLEESALNNALSTMNPSRNADSAFMTQNTLLMCQNILTHRQRPLHKKSQLTMASSQDEEDLIALWKPKFGLGSRKSKQEKEECTSKNPYSLWALGLGDFTRQKKAHQSPRFDASIGGGMAGFDCELQSVSSLHLEGFVG